MNYTQRTSYCASLRLVDIGKTITLNGWVHRLRDHGGIYFVDLRDRYGRTQIVINQDSPNEVQALATELHLEYCISVTGLVRARPTDTINTTLATGEIEMLAQNVEILSKSEVLPFMIEEISTEANEDLRLKHRYLDLRSGRMQYHMQLRHKVMQSARKYLNANEFLEIETPTLIRSTPEGARDFLVPSRFKEGAFYALPQSPQLYKQILMMSGMDKYYQFARCYRDEDARGDRQPEHTQLDIELSFIKPDDIYNLIEGLMHVVFKDCLHVELQLPFLRLSYFEAMESYGSDKPDLRFALLLQDFSEYVDDLDFTVFAQALALNSEHSYAHFGAVKMLRVPQAEGLSRKHIDQLEQIAKKYGAKGLAWTRYSSNQGFSGGISKFLSPKQAKLASVLALQDKDLLLFVADTWQVCCTALGAVRLELSKMLHLTAPNLADHNAPIHTASTNNEEAHRELSKPSPPFAFAWITDFPLFNWDNNTNSWTPAHHMFTMPQEQYLDHLEQNPGEVKGNLYDLVCNGVELASGSIRIHSPELQQRIFDIIAMPKEEAESRFGFLLEAMRYGAPPHGGIAPGLDRLLMLMTGSQTIREVMGFPKNTVAASPMDGSPNTVSDDQLEELHLQIVKQQKQN